MKKYLTGLVCALLLTGCQMGNNRNATNTPNDYNNTQDNIRDGIDEFGDDVRDGVNDIGEDIQEGYDDVRDGIDDNYDNNTDNNTTNDGDNTKADGTGPYSYGQPETPLWDFPSFCNSLVGRAYPESLL